ncbi:MAG: gluconate 2-dehydrogenase subunit 3 family protein [Deltaproteobacteria bacterium]|nr:gluconate 2-dehydrogenase subunit 3 family protein [Deltaproteobacteria bacterium]MBK9369300.1 gluconate 2-dehydrogenase subunit 3 family protein [Deltaproteobacteria bacterium]MBK9646169.1 gluconate 2-dehydrogenase subunit 3 family protein [Deltaproteobacteria bacterium]
MVTPPRAALLSRRRALTLGLMAGIAVSVYATTDLEPPAPGMKVLGASERALLDAVGDTLFPAGALGPAWSSLGLSDEVDRLLSGGLSEKMATPFRGLLRALGMGVALSQGARFVNLGPAERLELLSAFGEVGPLPKRLAHDALKSVMAMAYFGHPQVQRALGYHSFCHDLPREGA